MTTDEQDIQDIINTLEATWNTGDSEGYAAPFAEDVAFIHIFGGQVNGRRAVAASHRNIFDTIYKGSQVHFTLLDVRFLRPEVALVLTSARLVYSDGEKTNEVNTRPTLILTRNQRLWQIVAFQNTRVSEMPA